VTLSTNAIERIFSYFLAGKSYQNFEKTRKNADPMSGGFDEMPHGVCSLLFFLVGFSMDFGNFCPMGARVLFFVF
jgi:hypothetical protein